MPATGPPCRVVCLRRRRCLAASLARARDPDDARVVRLALTEHAARIHAAFDQIQCRISEDLGLAPGEARGLQLMLRDVATSVERALAPGD